MSQIHIAGAAHTVIVTHDGTDLAYLIEKAQKLYEETRPADQPAGPATGFQQVERQHQSSGFAWRMGEGQQPVVKP